MKTQAPTEKKIEASKLARVYRPAALATMSINIHHDTLKAYHACTDFTGSFPQFWV